MRKAVIVIPTYNERGNIDELIPLVFRNVEKVDNWKTEILIVDSRSPDKTADAVRDLQKKYEGLHLLETGKNGLGKAYIEGFNYAVDKLGAYLVFEFDADLSHDPSKLPEFFHKIETGCDFVLGTRYAHGGSIPSNWGIERKMFSIMGNLIARLGFMKLKVTDWTGGYRAIKAWLVKAIVPEMSNYSGYVFQIAFLDKALKKGAKIGEIPFGFIDRKYGKSKFNPIEYISQSLLYIFLNSSFIKFVIVGFIGFAIDFGISYIMLEKARAAVWLGTLLSTETAIISNFLLNNFWSFRHKKIQTGSLGYAGKFIKFNVISAGSILIQMIGIQVAVTLFGRGLWPLYKALIIGLVVIPYSYFFYNKVIWKEK